MVAQPRRLHSKKAGGQCPFPWPGHPHGRSLKVQLYEIADTLTGADELAQLLVYLAGATEQMPKHLRVQERLFLRAIRSGQVMKGLGA